MGCYLSHENGLPVFYLTYPGFIIDKSNMPYMMAYNDELNIQDVAFVMNRGLRWTANLKWLHSNNIGYVIGVEKTSSAHAISHRPNP
jgi:transposase